MFLMATLYIGAHSTPVKVRDMSTGGALIEGGTMPPLGHGIRLCRGSLHVSGEVVWTTGGRSGLRFNTAITVTDWLPRANATAPQMRIDEIVQLVKSSEASSPTFAGSEVEITSRKLTSLEITQLKLAIEALAEDLAADPDIVARHMEKLQSLDLTAQALTKLAAER